MQIDQFLLRVVPPGNYLVVSNTFMRQGMSTPGFVNRFYPYADLDQAASYLSFIAGKQSDTYFALASYKTAIADGTDKLGRPKFKGSRTQSNTQQLKALWIDLDVSRPGDGKPADKVYATRADARQWLKSFILAVGLPPPNMMVNSGYGYHAYWLLDDPMPTAEWEKWSRAMRAAMDQHGYKGDGGITIDAARVLRTPQTFNMKSGQPMLVEVLPKFLAPDWPNALVLDKLLPYVGVTTVAQQATATAAATGTHALAGGTVQPIFAGLPSMTGAMQAGAVTTARPRYFAKIAERCEQVKLSLANHGNGENRPIWYLGHLTLAVHCVDGADYVHPISDGDPRYNQANVDAHFQRAQAEHKTKGNGPPTCAHYNRERGGVCSTCPFQSQVTTPWQLGLDLADDSDLPDYYRRNNDWIEYATPDPKVGLVWHQLVAGDLGEATLSTLDKGGYVLTFNYYRADRAHPVQVTTDALLPDPSAIYKQLQGQGWVIPPKQETATRSFILAWIDKLRDARALRDDRPLPFGWNVKDGDYKSFAVAGTVYNPDGTETLAPGGDPLLVRDYTPAGKLENWKKAADFVMNGRVDLQVIIAVAFGAPLMAITGHAGCVFSAWSQQSAVGKTSAMKVGRAVWSAETTHQALSDTNNSALARLGITRNLPSFWDEMRGNTKEKALQISDLLMAFTQGKGKSRLSANSTLMPVDEWQTILMCASNYPLMEHVVAATNGTDAGAVRLFEWQINLGQMPNDAAAARIIQMTRHNYGHAGRIYAKFIIENVDKVIALITMISDKLTADLQPDNTERFFIAGIACVLVGAQIANRLGLCKFEVDAMTAMLGGHFHRLRDERRGSTLINASGVDLEQIFSLFMADHGKHKLITKQFAPQNPSRYYRMPEPDIKWVPTDRSRVDIHISQLDATIRVSRPVFNRWCHQNGLPTTGVINELVGRWKAKLNRVMLASGTGFVQGQIMCVDIPTTIPQLSQYLLLDATPPPQAAPTPGNQPKV